MKNSVSFSGLSSLRNGTALGLAFIFLETSSFGG